ncbi:MAG TPA: cyclic nucleotide-binding domain-containing protein [Anaerolineales bacterium]
MQSEHEKLKILKSVSIFFGTPEEVLLEAVPLLQEVSFRAGEKIFEKGDPGDSLYIITGGLVRVYDGERFLNNLGKWEVFGEMAALDPESRSASIAAIQDTQLLRLQRDALYDLMARRAEVTRGIIHILCVRLRDRTQDMAEDFQYMQQFAKVTSAAVAVEAGVYRPEALDEVAERTDELGQLARVFQRMVHEVYSREQRLIQEVAELRIEIDRTNQAEQVAEITETEYFQQLQARAHKLRSSHKRNEG